MDAETRLSCQWLKPHPVACHTNGHLASEDGPWTGDTVSFDYNTRGLLASLAITQPYASSLVQTFGYDAANRLTNTTSWAGSFGYAYHPGLGSLTTASRLTRKLSLPTGGYVTNTFDPLGRLTETTLKNAAHSALNRKRHAEHHCKRHAEHHYPSGS